MIITIETIHEWQNPNLFDMDIYEPSSTSTEELHGQCDGFLLWRSEFETQGRLHRKLFYYFKLLCQQKIYSELRLKIPFITVYLCWKIIKFASNMKSLIEGH